MLSPKTRARAVDRDEAVEVIEAAYVDGQLTREEYDVRSQRALEALTLGDVRASTKDLQRPLEQASATTAAANPTDGRRLSGMLVLAAILLAAGWVFYQAVTDDDSPPDAGSPPPAVDVFSADGFRDFVAALEERTGDTVVFDVSLVRNSGRVAVPADTTSDRSVSYTWRDSGFEEGESASTELDGVRIDLSRIDPAAMATNVEAAAALVEEPEDAVLTVHFDEDHPRQCYNVSVSNRFSETGRVYATCSGQVLRTDAP